MNPFQKQQLKDSNPFKKKTKVPENSMVGDLIDSFTQGVTFGFGDEITALEGALLGRQDGGWFDYGETSFVERYNQTLEQERAQQEQFSKDHQYLDLAAELGGGIATGVGLARSGATLTGLGTTVPGKMAYGALEGAGYGALAGAGYAKEDSRLEGAAKGSVLGAGIGSVAPGIVEGGKALYRLGLGGLGLNNAGRAGQMVAETVERSGKSLDEIATDMRAARADGQDVFTAADAMDKTGRRALSAVVRTPNEARQEVAEALMSRQAGQADRINNALSEGFEVGITGQTFKDDTETIRRHLANNMYREAREKAKPVNVNAAVKVVDDQVTPGIMKLADPGSNLAPESIDRALISFRGRMSRGGEQLTDFQSVFNLKRDVDNAIGQATRAGQGQTVNVLTPLKKELDNALADASQPYSNSRDLYRSMSKDLEAFDAGTKAATGTQRAPDNIRQFGKMLPTEQRAFRHGYVDPLMKRVENQAGPMADKSRAFTSEKFSQEFPEFASPAQAETLSNRLSRENKMHQTMSEALGGSLTADNAADNALLALMDNSVVTGLATGNYGAALGSAARQGVNALKGQNDSTTRMIAKALMETDPDAFLAMASPALRRGRSLTANEVGLARALSAQAGGSIAQ